jgi:hypothetical protein
MREPKDKIVIFSILAFVLCVLFLTNTITSGYHFVDDHEVIKMKSDLKTSSINTVAKSWVTVDLKSNGRFRPFYYIHRVWETRLFGSDFFLWSVYTGLLWFITMTLFYTSMRNLKYSWVESVIFIIILFIGPQSSVWWRLGPGESLGIFLLGLSFYFMTKGLNKKLYQFYNLLYIFFLILASLTKESFLLIIPAMVVFKVWNERIFIWSSMRESIIKNLILTIPLVVFTAELIIIKKYVGIAYSGLESSMLSNVQSVISTGLYFFRTYFNLLIVGLIFAIICFRIKKIPVKLNVLSFVFFILILGPNLILYAKSGLVERYLLPSTLGLAYMVVALIRGIDSDHERFKKLAVFLVAVSFLPYLYSTISESVKFANEGKSTGKLLSAISKNNAIGSQVMVIVDPVLFYEKSVSLKTYLFYEDNIDLYGYVIPKDNDPEYQGYVDGWKSYFEGKQYENMASKPGLLIFLDNNMIEEFFAKSNLPRNNYIAVEMGNTPFALLKETI